MGKPRRTGATTAASIPRRRTSTAGDAADQRVLIQPTRSQHHGTRRVGLVSVPGRAQTRGQASNRRPILLQQKGGSAPGGPLRREPVQKARAVVRWGRTARARAMASRWLPRPSRSAITIGCTADILTIHQGPATSRDLLSLRRAGVGRDEVAQQGFPQGGLCTGEGQEGAGEGSDRKTQLSECVGIVCREAPAAYETATGGSREGVGRLQPARGQMEPAVGRRQQGACCTFGPTRRHSATGQLGLRHGCQAGVTTRRSSWPGQGQQAQGPAEGVGSDPIPCQGKGRICVGRSRAEGTHPQAEGSLGGRDQGRGAAPCQGLGLSPRIKSRPDATGRVRIWRHSVTQEHDFVPPFTAQFLGAQLSLEQNLEACGFALEVFWPDVRGADEDRGIAKRDRPVDSQLGASAHMDKPSGEPMGGSLSADWLGPAADSDCVHNAVGLVHKSALKPSLKPDTVSCTRARANARKVTFCFSISCWFPAEHQLTRPCRASPSFRASCPVQSFLPSQDQETSASLTPDAFSSGHGTSSGGGLSKGGSCHTLSDLPLLRRESGPAEILSSGLSIRSALLLQGLPPSFLSRAWALPRHRAVRIRAVPVGPFRTDPRHFLCLHLEAKSFMLPLNLSIRVLSHSAAGTRTQARISSLFPGTTSADQSQAENCSTLCSKSLESTLQGGSCRSLAGLRLSASPSVERSPRAAVSSRGVSLSIPDCIYDDFLSEPALPNDCQGLGSPGFVGGSSRVLQDVTNLPPSATPCKEPRRSMQSTALLKNHPGSTPDLYPALDTPEGLGILDCPSPLRCAGDADSKAEHVGIRSPGVKHTRQLGCTHALATLLSPMQPMMPAK